MSVVTMRELLEAGVHFGHQTRRWNPKMRRYIFTERGGIYIIDLQQTLDLIEQAHNFVRNVAERGGTALEATIGEKGGVALRTKGRLELTERSGISSVSGGAEFVIPVAGGLSETSLVLATLQDHFPGVHVEAAGVLDVEEGLIVVRLSQAVPEPAKVAWLVLD